MILGCSPSEMYRSACFKSSPTSRTTDVVPSPQMSSWAVAALAIMTAVGFCICISRSSTLPSLVSLICEPARVSSSTAACPQHGGAKYLSRSVDKPAPVSFASAHRSAEEVGPYILMVPRGPRFDFSTSCRPSPALMLTRRASPRRCHDWLATRERTEIWDGALWIRPLGSEAVRPTCLRQVLEASVAVKAI